MLWRTEACFVADSCASSLAGTCRWHPQDWIQEDSREDFKARGTSEVLTCDRLSYARHAVNRYVQRFAEQEKNSLSFCFFSRKQQQHEKLSI